jgi:hypothetical protein
MALASSADPATLILKPLIDKFQAARKAARKFRDQDDFVERV